MVYHGNTTTVPWYTMVLPWYFFTRVLAVVYVLLGRAVTEYRWGGSHNILFMRHKCLVLTVKELLKSVYIYGSYRKIKTGLSLFWTTRYRYFKEIVRLTDLNEGSSGGGSNGVLATWCWAVWLKNCLARRVVLGTFSKTTNMTAKITTLIAKYFTELKYWVTLFSDLVYLSDLLSLHRLVKERKLFHFQC